MSARRSTRGCGVELRGRKLQARAVKGLRAFVGALHDRLETIRQERLRVPDVPAVQAETALKGLLSPTLLAKMDSGRPTVVQRLARPGSRVARTLCQ